MRKMVLRAVCSSTIERIADHHCVRNCANALNERIVDFGGNKQAAGSNAIFALIEKTRVARLARNTAKINVAEDDKRRFAAKLKRDALEIRRRTTANERNCVCIA